MRIGLANILASLLATLALHGPASAQSEPRTLAVAPDAAWQHAVTGMILPGRVGGLARLHIRDSSEAELDVVATYVDRDDGMIALIYVYRTMTPYVPVWFDRAVATIMLPQTGAAPPTIAAFARPGASAASGLRAVMTDSVAGMRSTAVAIVPMGTWLVKIRLGSARLDPAALDERLSAFVAALTWPAETGTARAAVPVEPCPTPLRLRTARIVRTEMTDVLMDSVIGTVEPEGEPGPPPVYCREPGATVERGVYRPDGATDNYLIAINDAGLAIGVGDASGLSALLGQPGRQRFSVTLLERISTSSFPSFNRLPPPDQALALVRGGQPLSVTTDGR
jgi:hypothetical protein